MDEADDRKEVALLFVYGSLRRGCDNDEARVLHAGGDWVGTGRVQGSLGEIDGYPALRLDAGGEHIEGDLFHMRDPDAMLAYLDIYEGCAPDSPMPHDYRRMVAPVFTASSESHAWLYVANAA